jgi:hypothetical protein
MTENFNADFYVTCATVIPVLFLALAVQGRTYEVVVQAVQKRMKRAMADDRPARRYWVGLLWYLLSFVPMIIVSPERMGRRLPLLRYTKAMTTPPAGGSCSWLR